jgi:hypothetical protein
MAKQGNSTVIPEAVPERTKLPQPTRHIEPPLAPGTKNTNAEPDTSQQVRPRQVSGVTEGGAEFRGEVPAPAFSRSIAEQLAEGAAANDTPLPPAQPPAGITTTASLMGDPHDIQPRFTDPRQAPPPPRPVGDGRTKIQVGPVDEAMVSEETVHKVRPKFTGSRFIGPYRYYFTKDVTCEVPKSVRDALLREDLIYPYFGD